MKQSHLHRSTGVDAAQALSIGELGKNHGLELFVARFDESQWQLALSQP